MTTALRFPIEQESAGEHARNCLLMLGALKRVVEAFHGTAQQHSDADELLAAIERRITKILSQVETP